LSQQEKLLEELCKKDEVDYKLAQALKRKIFPLLEEVRGIQSISYDRVLLEQKKGIDLRLNNSAMLLDILHNKVDRNKFAIEETMALSLHLEFLVLVEGFFATQINFLIFTLIVNGHDFYSTRKRRYAKTIDEIEEEDLALRIKFLEKHGFEELAKNENSIRKLRNSVAHVFYEIDSEGNVQIGKERINPKTYGEYYDYLRNIAFSIHHIRNLFYSKVVASFSPNDLERMKNVRLEEVKCSCGYVNLLPDDRRVLGHQFTCTKCQKPIQ
jgi:hypothetical protein